MVDHVFLVRVCDIALANTWKTLVVKSCSNLQVCLFCDRSVSQRMFSVMCGEMIEPHVLQHCLFPVAYFKDWMGFTWTTLTEMVVPCDEVMVSIFAASVEKKVPRIVHAGMCMKCCGAVIFILWSHSPSRV